MEETGGGRKQGHPAEGTETAIAGMTKPRWRVALINPNTDKAITARMVAMAERFCGDRLEIVGLTAPFGVPLLMNEVDLAAAELAVCALATDLTYVYHGVIVSAFGDPGASILADALSIPVVGIGEASIRLASNTGARFCIATTTPDLVAAIDQRVTSLGLSTRYAGVALTNGDARSVTGQPLLLEQALFTAIERAVSEWSVEVVIIGGGPLTDAAQKLSDRLSMRVINPVEAAVTHMLARLDAPKIAERTNTCV